MATELPPASTSVAAVFASICRRVKASMNSVLPSGPAREPRGRFGRRFSDGRVVEPAGLPDRPTTKQAARPSRDGVGLMARLGQDLSLYPPWVRGFSLSAGPAAERRQGLKLQAAERGERQ
jgi:hypothetical protein